MTRYTQSRRAFIGHAGAGLAGALAGPWTRAVAAVGPRYADLVVFNAKVYTVDAQMPMAEAFAIRDGRILAVGSSADMQSLIGKGTEALDARQMTIVPGFIDCHNHAPGETLLYDVLVGNPYEVEFVTIDSVVDKLRERAAQTPPGMWVDGFFFDDIKVKGGRQLDIHDLDRASSD